MMNIRNCASEKARRMEKKDPGTTSACTSSSPPPPHESTHPLASMPKMDVNMISIIKRALSLGLPGSTPTSSKQSSNDEAMMARNTVYSNHRLMAICSRTRYDKGREMSEGRNI